MRYLQFLIFFFSFLSWASVRAAPTLLGKYDSWSAFVATKGKEKTCYVVAEPINKEGKYSSRGDPYIFITHDEKAKTFDTFSTTLGYPTKEKSEVILKVASQSFHLFTQGDTAWAKDNKTDQAIIESLKAGKTLKVEGISTRGTETRDTYDLKGFTAAYKAISRKCSKQNK